MKFINPILTALVLFGMTLTGCMKEDDEGCEYDNNFLLRFAYPDENGVDRFSGNIESVGIYVFDEDFYYVTAVYADRSNLAELQGVYLSLLPGDYYIVGWGNHIDVYDYPILDGGTALEHSVFEVGHLQQPFYYAPVIEFNSVVEEQDFFKITVPDEEHTEAILPFRDASRPVNVTVIGLQEYLQETNKAGTDIELTNLPAGYDFSLSHLQQMAAYQKAAQYNGNTEDICKTTFHTPFFDIAPDIDINLYRLSNGDHIHGLNLKDALEKIGYMPEPTEPLDIQIKFGWGGISITINGWNDGGILTPDL